MRATKHHKVSRRHFLLGAAVFLAAFFVYPCLAAAESISQFESNIVVHDDASFTVTEHIKYDFGAAERHGIFRDIPLRHPQPATAWYKKRRIEIEIVSVLRDGKPELYQEEAHREQLSLQIGDAGTAISGEHTYTITYNVTGGLAYLESGAVEVYWNATGNDWPVTIARAVGEVGPPSQLIPDFTCYQGPVGSVEQCDESTTGPNGRIVIANHLTPGEGLTVAAALRPDLPVVIHESLNTLPVLLGSILLLIVGAVAFVYRTLTFHRPPHRTVIAQYEPYEDVPPMFTGVLFDNRLDGRDVTAGLLYLAEQGFLKVRKTERKILWLFNTDDYEVTLLRPVTEAPSEFHREVLGLIFFAESFVGTVTSLDALQANQTTQRENYKKLQTMQRTITADLIARGFYERVYGLTRRTAKGYDALWHLKGFKEFLRVTDAERFKFHNAPNKNPEQFMQFLPYAVAFGVEKEWAQVFKDVAIASPDWYEGGSAASFSAVQVAESLSAFSVAVNAASGSGYRSSSSAASGGGFSGGGGGGGGGRSW